MRLWVGKPVIESPGNRLAATRPQVTAAIAMGVVLSITIGACYDTTRCGAERCDGLDNDCDGRIDEAFTDLFGAFSSGEHCGSCNVACDEVFADATATECRLQDDDYRCVALACPAGERVRGGACVPETIALCAPCRSDEECKVFDEGSQCLAGDYCGQPCSITGPGSCPNGFVCTVDALTAAGALQDDGAQELAGAPQCVPSSGACECTPEQAGRSVGCVIDTQAGELCAGTRVCRDEGFGECRPALEEACNDLDDDCDGIIDPLRADIVRRCTGSTLIDGAFFGCCIGGSGRFRSA
jgi:hypothetical protein